MGNIVRWFEDFPSRALELIRQVEPVARSQDRIGTFSLLIAPALIIGPYERLQTFAIRKNPQRDFDQFQWAAEEFQRVMGSPFAGADFWGAATADDWRSSSVVSGIGDPSQWMNSIDLHISENGFWSSDIRNQETRLVWEILRDALAHWNVVTCDDYYCRFDEGGTMERLLFYRQRSRGPWDAVSVPATAFYDFLKAWAEYLARRPARDLLAAEAA